MGKVEKRKKDIKEEDSLQGAQGNDSVAEGSSNAADSIDGGHAADSISGGTAAQDSLQGATAGQDSQAGAAASDDVTQPPQQRAGLTKAIYDEAAQDIILKRKDLDYCVAGISRHFGAPVNEVRTQIELAMKQILAPAPKQSRSPELDPNEPLVPVKVPRSFQIHVGAGYKLIKAGTDKLQRSIAESQYAKDNGVKVLE